MSGILHILYIQHTYTYTLDPQNECIKDSGGKAWLSIPDLLFTPMGKSLHPSCLKLGENLTFLGFH